MAKRMIIVECNPDQALVRALGIPRRDVQDAGNKGNICNRLIRGERLIGLMDEDPQATQPRYFKELQPVNERHRVRVLQDPRRAHLVLLLCPRLEEWILAIATGMGMNVEDWNLPSDAKELHKIRNDRLPQFENLVRELDRRGSEALSFLKAWLHRGREQTLE